MTGLFEAGLVAIKYNQSTMKLQAYNYRPVAAKGLQYFSLVIAGLLIILLCSLIQHVPASPKGEGHYSSFLIKNFTLLPKALFVITGFVAGYVYRLTPWLVGVCLILIFPLTSIIEGVVYSGSHNLIPIEFAFHFWLALPSIIAAFIGRFIRRQIAKRKEKVDDKVVNGLNVSHVSKNNKT